MIVNTLPHNKNKLEIMPMESFPIFRSSKENCLKNFDRTYENQPNNFLYRHSLICRLHEKFSAVCVDFIVSLSRTRNDKARLENYDINLISTHCRISCGCKSYS